MASVAIAVALNLWETRGQTFFSDEWGRLMFYDSGGLETLLRGHSGHLVALHALLYKGLLEVFGAGSYLPFRIIEALLVGACGLLFYALARAPGGALAVPARDPRAAVPRLRIRGPGHAVRNRHPAAGRVRAGRPGMPGALSGQGRPPRLPAA